MDQKKVDVLLGKFCSVLRSVLGGPALKDPYTWGKVDMSAMARCLLVLCKQIYSIFAKENRLLRISSACYICEINSVAVFFSLE